MTPAALASAITSHAAAMNAATLTIGLAVPAVWGMPQLKAHYPTWSEDRIKAEFRTRVGHRGQRGHDYEVHVSKVRTVDAQLAREAGN